MKTTFALLALSLPLMAQTDANLVPPDVSSLTAGCASNLSAVVAQAASSGIKVRPIIYTQTDGQSGLQLIMTYSNMVMSTNLSGPQTNRNWSWQPVQVLPGRSSATVTTNQP